MSQHQITCVHKDGTSGIVTEFKSWTPVVQWSDGAERSSKFADLKRVVYRGCEIDQGMSAFAPIVFSHSTFDGAPDSGTQGRCGHCDRFSELTDAIDEMIELHDLYLIVEPRCGLDFEGDLRLLPNLDHRFLKPCPCGQSDLRVWHNHGAMVACASCGQRGDFIPGTNFQQEEEHAIFQWNRQVESQPVAVDEKQERTLIDVAICHFTEYRDQSKAAVLTSVSSTQEIIHQERVTTLDGCISFLKGLQKS